MPAAKDEKDRLPLTIESIMVALKATNGNVLRAAEDILGRNKQQIYHYLRKDDNDLKAFLQDLRDEKSEDLLDIAEDKLYGRVELDDWRAVQYTLDRKGHKRGYTPSSHTEEEVTFKVVREDEIDQT